MQGDAEALVDEHTSEDRAITDASRHFRGFARAHSKFSGFEILEGMDKSDFLKE